MEWKLKFLNMTSTDMWIVGPGFVIKTLRFSKSEATGSDEFIIGFVSMLVNNYSYVKYVNIKLNISILKKKLNVSWFKFPCNIQVLKFISWYPAEFGKFTHPYDTKIFIKIYFINTQIYFVCII